MKISSLLLLLGLLFLPNSNAFAQMKKFQRFYVGGGLGYAYVPLDDYNDYNAKFVLLNDPTGSRGLKPFETMDNFKPFTLDIYFRDSKEFGFRFFTEYYSSEISTKTASGNSTFTRSLTSLDFGGQFLWFLTEDYVGPQLLLGFGGALMLPVIRETNSVPSRKDEFEYDNISGGATVSIIGIIPVYEKIHIQAEAAYRFSRSSTFFEVNTNGQLQTDISLTGYIVKAGILYQITY